MRLLVIDLADILQEGMPLDNGAYGLLIVLRQTKHPDPVVTRTNGYNGNGNIFRWNNLLDKQAIYHLMDGAVTTDGNNTAITLIDGLYGKFRNMIFMLRKYQLIGNIIIPDEFGNKWQILQALARTSNGIDNHIPLIYDLLFC